MKVIKNFSLVVAGALVLRLLLALLPGFTIDMNNWVAWSRMLASSGTSRFYLQPGWTDYTPGFLYYLRILGAFDKNIHFGSIYPFLVKLPVVLADIGVGIVVYRLLRVRGEKIATFGFLAYVFNPAVVFTNSIWGQTDGLIALSLLLSVYFLSVKKKVLFSSLFWVAALLIKPQALFGLPVILFYAFFVLKAKKTLYFILYSAASIVLFGLPFFIFKNPVLGMPELILRMSHESPFTSVMAFNFWNLVVGMWVPDAYTFLKIPYFLWGTILSAVAAFLIFLRFGRLIKKPQIMFFVFGLTYLAAFLFSTRVHERYILVSLPFLFISATLVRSRLELGLFSAVSLLSFLNIYHPYAYYTKGSFLSLPGLLAFTTSMNKLISVAMLIVFFVYLFKDKISERFNMRKEIKTPEFNLSQKSTKFLLLTILTFSFLTRIGWLGTPANEYFDEVYHAFTARQILHGSPKAWEWWNTPPEGFAYEWTHPPLAKLGMVVGMIYFGENSFGWRIPGVLLGTACVYLVYLLAKEIFKDKYVGLLAAAVFGLDGLALVMSRIAMNDIYMLFFMLASVYLFLRHRDFFSALMFGLAMSSKWSAVWAVPIFFVFWLRRKRGFEASNFWFMVLPPLVYLASYIPMFVTGHNLSVFWEMQKQMWWYHTGLKATHPYTSPWWSWPVLLRPIYLYTSNEVRGMVSRIYAMGNPIVFWFGFVSIATSFIYSYLERNKNLAFVVFAYLIFFVPWAASPRIMFLYHYLPSIPFLAIASGYVLRKNPRYITPVLITMLVSFLYFYPHFAGLKIPLHLDASYYWFLSWR